MWAFHLAFYLGANLFLIVFDKAICERANGWSRPTDPALGFRAVELWVGCVSYYVDGDVPKLFELVKKGDLEGLVVKREGRGKYTQQTFWYKVLNLNYTQKAGTQKFFQRQ